jgi:hypothetical protein
LALLNGLHDGPHDVGAGKENVDEEVPVCFVLPVSNVGVCLAVPAATCPAANAAVAGAEGPAARRGQERGAAPGRGS